VREEFGGISDAQLEAAAIGHDQTLVYLQYLFDLGAFGQAVEDLIAAWYCWITGDDSEILLRELLAFLVRSEAAGSVPVVDLVRRCELRALPPPIERRPSVVQTGPPKCRGHKHDRNSARRCKPLT